MRSIVRLATALLPPLDEHERHEPWKECWLRHIENAPPNSLIVGEAREVYRMPIVQRQQQVGEAVRRLRDAQRLSLRTLAAKCGFSASFLSQVELRKVSPSLASLERIAAGLGVTLGHFFLPSESSTPSLIKSSQRLTLQSGWSRAQIESLRHPDGDSRFEVLMITLRSGGCSSAELHARETETCVIVFSGKARLQVGKTSHLLQRGDAITIPAGTPHRWENTAAKDVQILQVVGR